MYTKNKFKRITLRLSDEQFEYVQANSEMLGVSPSEFFRMVVNAAMVASVASKNAASRVIADAAYDQLIERGVVGRENDKTDIND